MFLEMRNIIKLFPGVLANNRVNLTVEQGEIHALLGENGAGKSTLMQILYGLYERDSGDIFVRGQPVTINSPHDAIALGIGMIHQEFMLIPRLSVTENVVMGLKDNPTTFLLDLKGAADRLTDLSHQHGLDVDPHARVEHLSVGVQQRVEILKLLYRNAQLLILDEPTAVLTPHETERLFDVIRSLADQGHSIILITHKLHEVMAIAHRVTILRGGQVVSVLQIADTNPRELARMMVGREIALSTKKDSNARGASVLKIDDLSVLDQAGQPKLRGLSLELFEGEILGLAGVDGNGQSELAEAIMNLLPIERGRIVLDGVDITHASPAAHRAASMGYIPADRRQVGSIGVLSIAQNAILGDLRRFAVARHTLLSPRRIKQHAQALVERFDVRTPGIGLAAGKLSGGNLQKMILGRELMRQPRAMIVEQPTRGLDIGAAQYVYSQLLAARERGTAILLISVELDEILSLSDRIAVIYRGEIMGVLDRRDVNPETIGLMMAGSRAEALVMEDADRE